MGTGVENRRIGSREKGLVEIRNNVTCGGIWPKLDREIEVGGSERAEDAVDMRRNGNVSGS